MDAACTAAGIPDAETLRRIGPDEAYARLLRNGTKPHFIGYYVLVMGLQGRPWNDCKGDEKTALRKRFDTLKAQNTPSEFSELEKALDALGIVPRQKPDP